jgi:hypothetical protein
MPLARRWMRKSPSSEPPSGTEISIERLSGLGRGVDLISDVAHAVELVRRIGAETEARLQHASDLLQRSRPTGSTT